MTRQFKYFLITIAFVLSGTLCAAEYTGPICDLTPQSRCIEQCQGSFTKRWSNCFGSWTASNGNKYVGEFKDGKYNGQGTFTFADGEKYVGEFKDDNYNGRGIYYSANGSIKESGIFKEGTLVTAQYIDPNSFTRIARNNSAPAVTGAQSKRTFTLEEAYGMPASPAAIPKNQNNLPACVGTEIALWSNCFASYTTSNGDKYEYETKNGKINGQGAISWATGDNYVGQFKDNYFDGQGTFTWANGTKYVGEWKNSKWNGKGIHTKPDGYRFEGIFEDNRFIREAKVNLPSLNTNTTDNTERNNLELERQRLAEEKRKFEAEKTLRDQEARQVAEERRRLEAQKAQIEQEKKASRIAIKGSASQPDVNGDFTITIQTGADTASLKIDGEEVGGKRDGNYVIKRVARVGEQNSYSITARDVFGNIDSVTITVARQVADSRAAIPRLNPAGVKVQQSRDAVAIIIGIENYRRVAKADFANADAKDFYTYASRALGIEPENIKLLVDDGADDIEMLNAFQNWLPLKVNKGKTDVYVFYSGHGYPSQDGNSLYFLPFNVDKQYLDRTSVKQKEVVSALQKAQAKSVTMFIDACYSGQTRGGEVLIAGLKPIVPKTDEKAYPAEFTVITASAADQFSSASQDLKHGIFSFYLMKGMEGDADLNKDGRITSGELQQYLSEMVGRQAMGLNRTQNTQLFGDANKVLVGR